MDFAKLAEAVGCFAIRVEHPDQIQGTLDLVVASGKPAVLDVVTDINGIAPQAWSG